MSRRDANPGRFEYALKQSLGACEGSVADQMQVFNNIPAKDVPSAVYKELTVQLPTDDLAPTSAVQTVWNAKTFNPFGFDQANAAAGIIDVGDNTTVPGGQLGCAMCVMGVGFEMEGEPEVWSLLGNSYLSSELTAGTSTPVSPDAYNQEDIGSAAADSGKLGAGIVPAVFEFGTPTWRFIEDIIRGWDFKWRVGNGLNIVNTPAEDMASCGDNGGPRGLSRSDTGTRPYVQRLNALYAGLTGFSNRVFIEQNATRDGFVPTGLATAGVSTFVPSRDGDFTKVAFGKERNSSKLYCNPCKQWFGNPLYLREGLPLQLFLEKNNGQEYINRALENLGSTYNGQMTQLDANTVAFAPAAAATAQYQEWDSRAAVPAAVLHNVVRNRIYYKWGQVKMRICLYGALLVDDALRAMVTGMQISKSGTGGWSGVHQIGSEKMFLGGVVNAEQIAQVAR